MRLLKTFGWLTLAAGLALPGVPTLRAEDWDRDVHHDRRDLRNDYRDLGHDYDKAARLKADIARDRRRLDNNVDAGRSGEAAHDARDLASDQRKLGELQRDIRHDKAETNFDRRDLHRDYRDRDADFWRDR